MPVAAVASLSTLVANADNVAWELARTLAASPACSVVAAPLTPWIPQAIALVSSLVVSDSVKSISREPANAVAADGRLRFTLPVELISATDAAFMAGVSANWM